MFLLGCYHYFNLALTHPIINYSPVGILVMFGLTYSLFLSAAPFTLMSEIFSQQTRSLGCGLSVASRHITSFIVLKQFFYLKNLGGMELVYWLNAGLAIMMVLFVWLLLPETRNKTYTELDQTFSKIPSIKE